MADEEKPEDRSYVRVAVITTIVVAVLWLALGHIPIGIAKWAGLKELNDAGQYGDSFGFVNSLFSGLAFAGVILTILLQAKELSLQRAELALQRREMKESKDALRRSAEAQENSVAALGKQADSMLISAYLNAQTAIAEKPAVQRAEQDIAARKIAIVTAALDGQVEELLDRSLETQSAAELTADKIEKLANHIQDILNFVIPGEHDSKEVQHHWAIASADFASVMPDVTSANLQQMIQKLDRRIRSLAEWKTPSVTNTVDKNKREEQYYHEGINVAGDLETLAHQLRDEARSGSDQSSDG